MPGVGRSAVTRWWHAIPLSAALAAAAATAGDTLNCSSICIGINCSNTCNAGVDALKGSGNVIERGMAIKGVSRISVGGGIVASISRGADSKLVIRADDNIQDKIKANVSGDSLGLTLASGTYQDVTVEVDIFLPAVAQIEAHGTAEVELNSFRSQQLRIVLDGSTSIRSIDSSAEQLTLISEGNGSASLTGFRAKHADVELSGVSEISLGFAASGASVAGTLDGVSTLYFCGRPDMSALETAVVSTVEQLPDDQCGDAD